MILHHIHELRDLGWERTAFRLGWELQTRSGLLSLVDRLLPTERTLCVAEGWTDRLPYAAPHAVRACIGPLLSGHAVEQLDRRAQDAAQGEILAFGRWTACYGRPPAWHRSPTSASTWNRTHWTAAVRSAPAGEDIKLVWEIGRFPHAYHLARATAFQPSHAELHAHTFLSHVESFQAENPRPFGVHWASGQEIAFRLFAWLFATSGLLRDESFRQHRNEVARACLEAAAHIRRHIQFAAKAVYNNHILSEGLALYAVGGLFPEQRDAEKLRILGRSLLDEHVPRQFYADGGYIQQSHNYHRLALQVVNTACVMARAFGERPSDAWLSALDRSVSFLCAQQNPSDGRLPNYGANDGALPLVLSTCDFSDFRPTLQTSSLLARGTRLYPPGPWDEESCWLLGSSALDAPERAEATTSVSFPVSGFHVQRGRDDSSSFSLFRCGTLRDRFSQIDMLHVDVWWRGLNVLVDAGSYLYNGPREWHNHFTRTASHNTITVDGLDQMLHFRPFKYLYPTHASLLQAQDAREFSLRTGEHYGYQRDGLGVTHRRAVLMARDDCWVVVDTVFGSGSHDVRLHWLAGDFPLREVGLGKLALTTEVGLFHAAFFTSGGLPLEARAVRGQHDPPEGWLSRYYGEKTPVPSLVVRQRAGLPVQLVSVLTADGVPRVAVDGPSWRIQLASKVVGFVLSGGGISHVRVEGQPAA